MIDSLLIANRGEIACRIIRTAHKLGIRTVAVYSDADAGAVHVSMADRAISIGPSPASESYLNGTRIISAAKSAGVQAIHPGYGFLSENPDFVQAVQEAGIVFVGPRADAIRAMGLKDAAKALMTDAGVPVVPGYHGENQDPALLAAEADAIGYPVMIKARAGGGGKGMRMVENSSDFQQALLSAVREGQSAFGDSAVLVEKYITSPRHIEVQVFGDNHGNVVHCFERDCSLQRRHQKVIEEAPAPGMTQAVRQVMTEAAVKAARAIDYTGAGTIEFIADGSQGLRADGFWFMEMNTRLQVEHPVTEAITGLDLVEWQIRVASGESLPLQQNEITMQGHAFEARVYAEDVVAGFLPATGFLQHAAFAANARTDTGVHAGSEITPFYDPMIAKVIVHADTREQSLNKMTSALQQTHIAGTVTNLEFLIALSKNTGFSAGEVDTGLIDRNLHELAALQEPPPVSKLLAAICLSDIEPGSAFCGWRMWGEASHLIDLFVHKQNERCRLSIHANQRLSLHDATGLPIIEQCIVTRVTDTEFVIVHAGSKRSIKAVSWRANGERCVTVSLDGRAVEFKRINRLNVDAIESNSGNQIRAPMTGVVRQVDVETGQRVSAGQALLALEAMKMETVVEAPRDGVVEAVNCQVGEAVDGGSVLVALVIDAEEQA
ncbi:MAG: biotin carboxylase N-terminal domain-containing protein [Granulosicoccus sp.]